MKSWRYRSAFQIICLMGFLVLWQAGSAQAQASALGQGKPVANTKWKKSPI